MLIGFQADADLNQIIVLAVLRRGPASHFRTATAAGLTRPDRSGNPRSCRCDERLLVTHDLTTMPRYFGDFVLSQRSPGLLVVPQHLPAGQVADDLVLIWTATQPDEWIDRVVFLPI